MKRAELNQSLESFVSVKKVLKQLDETELAEMIEMEFAGHGRWTVIERLVRRMGRVFVNTRLEDARSRYKKLRRRDAA